MRDALSRSDRRAPVGLVVGLGNELRRDDGVGIEVVRRLRREGGGAEGGVGGALGGGDESGVFAAEDRVDVVEHQSEPSALLDVWEGRPFVIVVDAVSSGTLPGTVMRLDASEQPLPTRLFSVSSTHAVSLADAMELARALGRLPARAIVYAVEGERFEAGSGLSAAVSAAVPAVVDAVRRELA